MPRFDRTGPEGQGSQTGCKMGKCNPNNQGSTKHFNIKETADDLERRAGRGMGKTSGIGKSSGKGLGRGLGKRNGKNNA